VRSLVAQPLLQFFRTDSNGVQLRGICRSGKRRPCHPRPAFDHDRQKTGKLRPQALLFGQYPLSAFLIPSFSGVPNPVPGFTSLLIGTDKHIFPCPAFSQRKLPVPCPGRAHLLPDSSGGVKGL
jgi:hypothetical protein